MTAGKRITSAGYLHQFHVRHCLTPQHKLKCISSIVFFFTLYFYFSPFFNLFPLLPPTSLRPVPGHVLSCFIPPITPTSCHNLPIFVCLFLARKSPVGQGLLIHEVSRSHTTTHHGRWDDSGRVITSSQRPLPDNTQHSQQTDIHAPGWIRNHDLSR